MIFSAYGLIVGIASAVWWSMAEYLEPRLKRLIPWILCLSLIGARAYHVFEYWDYYQADITSIPRVWEGGLSIWGALLLCGGYLVFRVKNMLWAVITPLPLAQAIGRVANGVNGEFDNLVLGIPWWGMEAILDLVLFAILVKLKKEQRVGGYIVGYGLIRLVLQPYRM
ncbi:prolipoprotein diacylglyceryl transferase [Candidatus Woesebacteria bacterium]|nr:prolipoprotein diacylglyceryl transferase [Candidatus Woesebacteria bacterium]